VPHHHAIGDQPNNTGQEKIMILLTLQFFLVSCNLCLFKTTTNITITTTTTTTTTTTIATTTTTTTNNNNNNEITSYMFYVLTKYRNNFKCNLIRHFLGRNKKSDY
jgi:hypothetical protein